MNKITESQIIIPQHHFLYGEKTEDRTSFLKGMESDYSLGIDQINPSVIYLSDIGLPISRIKEGIPKRPIDLASYDYTLYSLLSSLVKKIIDSDDYAEIEYRSKELFSLLNEIYLKDEGLVVHDYSELAKTLDKIKASYQKYYASYCQTGVGQQPTITSIDLVTFLKDIKEILNNTSIIFILDHQSPLNPSGYQAINSLIGSLRPKLATINVASSFDDWKSYYTFAGEMLNYDEDYDIIDLDGNFERTQASLAKKYSFDE